LHQHWGKPPGPDLSAAPFPFGVVAPTGDNGTSFPAIDKWDEWILSSDRCMTKTINRNVNK